MNKKTKFSFGNINFSNLTFFAIGCFVVLVVIVLGAVIINVLSTDFDAAIEFQNDRGGITYTNPNVTSIHEDSRVTRVSPSRLYTLPENFPADLLPVMGIKKASNYGFGFDHSNKLYFAEVQFFDKNSSAQWAKHYENYFSRYTLLNKKVVQNEYQPEDVDYAYEYESGDYRFTVKIEWKADENMTSIQISAYHLYN